MILVANGVGGIMCNGVCAHGAFFMLQSPHVSFVVKRSLFNVNTQEIG